MNTTCVMILDCYTEEESYLERRGHEMPSSTRLWREAVISSHPVTVQSNRLICWTSYKCCGILYFQVMRRNMKLIKAGMLEIHARGYRIYYWKHDF